MQTVSCHFYTTCFLAACVKGTEFFLRQAAWTLMMSWRLARVTRTIILAHKIYTTAGLLSLKEEEFCSDTENIIYSFVIKFKVKGH